MANANKNVQTGGGNVFADMGLAHADERLAKAELMRQIADVIQRAGWTQADAARRLGIDQPKVSALLRGRLSGFSTDRLLRFLNAIGQDVEIIIRPHKSKVSHRPTFRVTRRVA
ncbi:MAG: helix-turn-helix domain-containing protein [Phycisphaerales bacterium]